MNRRVDLKKILRDSDFRERLIAGVIQFCASHEGRDLTMEEAKAVTRESKENRDKIIKRFHASHQVLVDKGHATPLNRTEKIAIRYFINWLDDKNYCLEEIRD